MSAASGKTTEPMSRPSATRPGGCRKPAGARAARSRTAGTAATREAAALTSSARSRRSRRAPSSQIAPAAEVDVQGPRDRRERRVVVEVDAALARRQRRPGGTARRCRESGSRAPRRHPRATVPLPEADGPSIAMTAAPSAAHGHGSRDDRREHVEVVREGLGHAARIVDAHRPPPERASEKHIAMRWSS